MYRTRLAAILGSAAIAVLSFFLLFPQEIFAAYIWTQQTPDGLHTDQYWYVGSTDTDATTLMAAIYGGRLYTSANSGGTWTERQPGGNVNFSWTFALSDSDGSNMFAGAWGGRLYTSSDSGANWTERQPAGNTNKYWVAGATDADGSNLIAGAGDQFGAGDRLYTSSDGGANWTERQPAGNTTYPWYSAASDADGSTLMAGASNGRLYTSSDSGVNWTERQPAGAVNTWWTFLDVDSTGTNMLAGVNGGRLYTSSDGGVNWTERQPVGNSNQSWSFGSMDTTGAYILVGVDSGLLYLSDDGGDTWEAVDGPKRADTEAWYSVNISDSNLNLFVASTVGRLFTSTDAGETFTERQPAGAFNFNWRSDSDADGSNLIASVFGGRLYTSSDSGANWTERQPAGALNRNWVDLASDDDGSTLGAAIYNGRLYTSSDSGVNWTERQPGGDVNLSWNEIAVDADGSDMIAVSSGASGRVYTSSDGGVNWTERQPAGAVVNDWDFAAIDADGSTLVTGEWGGRLYTSSDGGVNWTERQPAGNADKSWTNAATSDDGSFIIVSEYQGNIYTSANGGANWTQRSAAGLTPTADQLWASVASDPDGSHLLAGMDTGYVYSSTDSGATWAALPSAGRATQFWTFGSVIDNGDSILVGAGTGRVFTGALDAGDSTAPSVSVTAPADASTVSGSSVSITATASDDTAVVGVQFKRDTNTLIGSEDTSSPYSTTWDTTALSDGDFDLIAVARDAAGNYATSTIVTVTVDNTAPTVSITAPVASATVSGATVSITADATDAGSVAGVQFKLDDGTLIGSEDTSAAYSVTWDTTALSDGNFSLIAVARDDAGNYATSSTITVSVDNTADVAPAETLRAGTRRRSVATTNTPSAPAPCTGTGCDMIILMEASYQGQAAAEAPSVGSDTALGGTEEYEDAPVGLSDGPETPSSEPPKADPLDLLREAANAEPSQEDESGKDAGRSMGARIKGALTGAGSILGAFFGSLIGPLVQKSLAYAGLVFGGYKLASSLFSGPIAKAELGLIPVRLFSLLLTALGIRKKNRPWGTVYDSVTKEPLDPAYVVIKDATGNEVSSSVTDIDGRYGFLVPPGTYGIEVNKTNYKFPSQKLSGMKSDELYGDLYFGGTFRVEKGDTVAWNIPLDQQNFDWNEFAKIEHNSMAFFSKRDLFIRRVSNLFFAIGFGMSVFTLFIAPSVFHGIVCALYVILAIFLSLGVKSRTFGTVVDQAGRPLSFGIVRVYYSGTSTELMHKVIDRYGRYLMLVPPGGYQLTVERKNADGSYSVVHTTAPFECSNGVIRKDFKL